jgi:ER membrane protein complex subunit 8/9
LLSQLNLQQKIPFSQIDNKSVCLNMEYSALKVWHKLFFDTKWVTAKFAVADSEKTLDAVSSLLQRGAMKELNDFDNYLDNTESDWSNEHLNRDLNQILSMH